MITRPPSKETETRVARVGVPTYPCLSGNLPPAISCGAFGYPLDQACPIALREIRHGLQQHPTITRIILACFDRDIFNLYNQLLHA